MKFYYYNMMQAARALNKSYPTILRWYRDHRMKPDGYTPLDDPIFTQTTIDALLKEIKDGKTPSVKEDDIELLSA